jgi:dihydroorotate dehydrogenase electron transfer subunit
MCNHDTIKKRSGMFIADVVYNRPVGQRYFRLSMAFEGVGAAAFANARAGQFMEIRVENLSIPECTPDHLKDAAIRNPILRRPFSFVDIFEHNGKTIVNIIYAVIGAGTVRLTSLRPGDQVSVIGPLGNGFEADRDCKIAVLIAGGIGCPPIEHLAKELCRKRSDIRIAAFVGARSVNDLPFAGVAKELQEGRAVEGIEEFERFGAESAIATDDGSAGMRGFVTAAVEKWLDENNIDAESCEFFACGPDPMLAAASMLAQTRGIKCMVSLERMMACGIGLCQSCAVEVRAADGEETEYKLCCKDGPVFDSKAVVW